MIQTIIIFIALLLSVFCHYNANKEPAWWESYIPVMTLFALVLSVLLTSNRNKYLNRCKYPIIMGLILLTGLLSIFLCNTANTSIRAMYIAFATPSIIYLYDTNKKELRTISAIIFIICLLVMIHYTSRTGIITMLLSGIYFLKIAFNPKKKYLISTFVILIPLILLFFFIKRDSSSGRMFILKNTAEMIMEKPFGRGSTGFETDYMIKQAEYFRNNIDEENAMLADDIKHPLNEYIYVAVNYGIQTLVVILVAVALLINILHKENSGESRCFIHFITLLLLWSFFSYPFSVAYTKVVLLAYIAALPQTWKLLSRNKYITPLLSIALLFYCGIELRAFNDEMKWNNAIKKFKNRDKETAMLVFEKSDDYLIDKGRMLYSLATIEYQNKNYSRCIILCNECKKYSSGYDIEILLANSYMFIGDYTKSLEHYSMAHNMCPVRFIPLYKQFKIYKELGDTVNMKKTGNKILSKQVKIPSRKIDIIINNVKYELQNMNSDITINNH
ncbi:MAG: O-antigen ligase family protein [Bacteroidaceae bacterium]|nr:O-antigen ligase family protein [Bacteroidaceae bacterium]MBQ8270761.1 O-antigen ligase family protein [Bacteroidaceae bacterium]